MKKVEIIMVLAIIITSIFGCDKSDEMIFENALNQIQESWTYEKLEDFASKEETKALSEIHFGEALYYRNKWFRSPEDSTLLNYFHSLNIYHEDYMSSIVFKSLHRKLNDRPINLEEQLKEVHAVVNEYSRKEKRNTQRGLTYYQNYNVGDTILFRMPLKENKNAFYFSFPDESNWIYNDSSDFLIRGLIHKKPRIVDSSDIYWSLKVISMNHENVRFLAEEIKEGDFIDVNLRLGIVE